MKNQADYSKYKCPYEHLEKECGHELKGPEGFEDTYGVWCACGFRGPVFFGDPSDLNLELKQDPEIPLDFDWSVKFERIRYNNKINAWEFEYKSGWGVVPYSLYPMAPLPPGYEDGRIFEKPWECPDCNMTTKPCACEDNGEHEKVIHPTTCTDEYCIICHGVKKASQRPLEATGEKTCFYNYSKLKKRWHTECGFWFKNNTGNCEECGGKIVDVTS